MNKISGILPSSSRIRSVDLSDGPGRRPGAPELPVSKPQSLADKFSVTPMTDRQRRTQKQTEIINSVSDGFFQKRIQGGLPTGLEEVQQGGIRGGEAGIGAYSTYNPYAQEVSQVPQQQVYASEPEPVYIIIDAEGNVYGEDGLYAESYEEEPSYASLDVYG